MKAVAAILGVLVAAGLAFFLTTSKAPSAEMTEAEIAQIEAEVKAVADGWRMNFLDEVDVEEFVNTQSDWAGGALDVDRSLDAARARLSAVWPTRENELVGQLDTEVRVLAPNVATVNHSYRSVRTETAGVPLVRDHEDYHVWVLEDAGWKVLLVKRVFTTVEEG